MRRELDGGFELDDDRSRIDADAVHAFISTESYRGLGLYAKLGFVEGQPPYPPMERVSRRGAHPARPQ